MASSLDKITIEGFKSIRSLQDFKLGKLNLLVGANGAGKSNFVEFFRLLRAMSEERLALFVKERGKADAFLFNGPKITDSVRAHLAFGENEYRFTLKPTVTGELIVAAEEVTHIRARGWVGKTHGQSESGLKSWEGTKSHRGPWPAPAHYVYDSVSKWTVYHFHDTSNTALMRRDQGLRDFRELRPDAGNIAAFLHHLKVGTASPSGSSEYADKVAAFRHRTDNES